jgi:hypothetical protein
MSGRGKYLDLAQSAFLTSKSRFSEHVSGNEVEVLMTIDGALHKRKKVQG